MRSYQLCSFSGLTSTCTFRNRRPVQHHLPHRRPDDPPLASSLRKVRPHRAVHRRRLERRVCTCMGPRHEVHRALAGRACQGCDQRRVRISAALEHTEFILTYCAPDLATATLTIQTASRETRGTCSRRAKTGTSAYGTWHPRATRRNARLSCVLTRLSSPRRFTRGTGRSPLL